MFLSSLQSDTSHVFSSTPLSPRRPAQAWDSDGFRNAVPGELIAGTGDELQGWGMGGLAWAVMVTEEGHGARGAGRCSDPERLCPWWQAPWQQHAVLPTFFHSQCSSTLVYPWFKE